VDRRALAKAVPDQAAAAGPWGGADGRPRNSVAARLVEIRQELLRVERAGVHDNFFELGDHSLLAVPLFARVEAAFGARLPLSSPFVRPTVAELAESIHLPAAARQGAGVIVPFNEQGQGPSLNFVHSIAGEVASFRHLARLLGPGQRFYGIQVPPERQSAEFASSSESLARHYVEEVVAFQPEGPCLLGGWSAGSTIAMEMAQQLTARGRTVELLIALDGAPYNTNSATSLWGPLYYWKLLRNVPRWATDDLLYNFSAPVLLRRVRNKVAAFSRCLAGALRDVPAADGHVSGYMDEEHFSPSHVAFMNALYAALRACVAKPYGGRALLHKSRTQPLYHLIEPERAWPKVAAHLDVVVVPGTHVGIVQEPYILPARRGPAPAPATVPGQAGVRAPLPAREGP
jgi:thioesterase domain-containing protein